ncbi:MAG: acyl-CoA dehydrogenase family protein [SAR324 cluster bacterium]|nr:acyl-CoA dehydrogenase family protein [SAR324 cluster bacterium]
MADRSYLDWPFFEKSHRKLAKELDDWCRQTKWPHHGDSVDATDEACRKRVQLLAEGGWLRWCVPMEYGGKHESLDVRSLCLIRETLARYDALADFSFAMQGLGSGAISLYGNSKQKQKILEEVSTGRMIAGFALSETDAGSDVAAMSSKAFSITEGWKVNGEKSWISNGGIADYYTFFAKTSDQPGSGGISAFLLKADNPGLSIAERQEVMAPHPLARLHLKDAELSLEALLGEEGKGFGIAMATLNIFRPTVGAVALGFARRALDEILHYSGDRKMYGQTMQNMPVVRSRLGEMELEIDASALLVYRAAWAHDQNQGRVTREASMAKLYATEKAQQVIDTAVQLFGARGVEKGNPVESLYREIRALRIYEGASEVHQQILGDQAIRSYNEIPK